MLASIAHLNLPAGWKCGYVGQNAALEELDQGEPRLPIDSKIAPVRFGHRIAHDIEPVEERLRGCLAIRAACLPCLVEIAPENVGNVVPSLRYEVRDTNGSRHLGR